jgi:hypothetical protein
VAQILKFPNRSVAPIIVRSGQKHVILVEVVDRLRPKMTRWILQFAVQNAAGFSALDGLKDKAVAKGHRHRFTIGKTRLLRRFVAETSDLVADGLVVINVDGVLVQPRVKRLA